MQRAGRRSLPPWIGPIFYRVESNYQNTYVEIEIIGRTFTGWNIDTIKAMTVRERTYWRKLIEWRLDADGRAAAGG